MVHKKSTYRLMYKNYGAEVRREVWQENNSLRLRRREEEMSHHSIEETESECECDASDEEEPKNEKDARGVSSSAVKGILSKSIGQENGLSHAEGTTKVVPPHVPRLQFSPEHTPRNVHRQTSEETANTNADATTLHSHYNNQDSCDDLNGKEEHQDVTPQSRRNVQSGKEQLGVLRMGSREYDLLPVARDEEDVRPKSAPSAKSGMSRSSRYPYTTQLTRTTRKNFLERNKNTYVPSGTGCKVQHTALRASSLRNREIENLMRKQQKLTLDDWREQNNVVEPVNHSSVFADGSKNIFKSKSRPRENLIHVPSRVEVFSNYCKHCGGRK
ncbi:uncharacterized protein LOC125026564 isoform X2 [Penaeus chinensis]|uniref:uncharacterized protein LOC125026564 isoform X2 n=1 Tax=Penaeus chinensis TaxID=139456 RepID=UPI001FB830CC|nr:uncharacterized protein LOC125026564 isoform X2 [Penaeus chinensis]